MNPQTLEADTMAKVEEMDVICTRRPQGHLGLEQQQVRYNLYRLLPNFHQKEKT